MKDWKIDEVLKNLLKNRDRSLLWGGFSGMMFVGVPRPRLIQVVGEKKGGGGVLRMGVNSGNRLEIFINRGYSLACQTLRKRMFFFFLRMGINSGSRLEIFINRGYSLRCQNPPEKELGFEINECNQRPARRVRTLP